ncbi:hypothetical protein EDC04DRAFT_2619015, partial [Pisolithus marmoratus]
MQSITVEKVNVPMTRRKQTFEDILSLLKHHNAGVRKDAIFSVRELFNDYPDLITTSMAPLFSVCARLIGDTDAGVRKALLSCFEWLLVRVAKDDLIPHASLLLLFTTSAQTHIFPEIRVDAVRYLDLFMGALPEYVVMGLGRRILDGYLGLLNVSTKFAQKASDDRNSAASTGSVTLSAQSRLVVLRSLSNFLCCAVCRGSVTDADVSGQSPAMSSFPTWFIRPFFATTRLYEEHGRLFKGLSTDNQEKQMFWTPEPASDSFDEDFAYSCNTVTSPPVASSILTELSDCFADRDGSCAFPSDVDFLMRLARALHPTLIASYLDCAPVVFSPSISPPDTDLQLLTVAMELTRTLYSVVLQSASQVSEAATHCDDLKALLGHLSGYFPFRPAHRDAKVEQALQNLNVIYCELASLLVLVLSLPGLGPTQQRGNRTPSFSPHTKVDKKLQMQTESIRSYVVRLLKGEGESGAQLPRPLTPTVYIALLPSIWALLNHLDGQNVYLDEAVSTTSSSTVKHVTIEFVARLLLLEKERGYIGSFNPRGAVADEKWLQWILHLPKVLWELNDGNLSTSVTLIQALLHLLQRGSFVVQHEVRLLSTLPYCVRASFRSSPLHTRSRGKIPGPFRKLAASSPRAARLALDLSAVLLAEWVKAISEDSSGGYEDLDRAVRAAIKGTMVKEYWAHLTSTMMPECPTLTG